MKTTTTISRRKFLNRVGGVTFVISAGALAPTLITAAFDKSLNGTKTISAWVHIGEDNQVTILNPAAEMGQGSMTALAVIIAEELDVDWANVTIQDSPIEPDVYGLQWGGRLGGPMITVGSRTVRGYYLALRLAGAQARKVLMQHVATKWGVPITELNSDSGVVIHEKSGQKVTYGTIVATLKLPEKLPEVTEVDLKNPKEFRLIGKKVSRFDIPTKSDGTAQYAIDVQVPGMLYAVISRSPVNGAKPTLLNEQQILTMKGIYRVIPLNHGIGIVGESFELCQEARKSLKIDWSPGAKATNYQSVEAYDSYQNKANSHEKGEVITEEGNVNDALASAARTFESNYKNDFVYHAQMEPLNAVVTVAEDGKSAEAWVGSQAHDGARKSVADVLGIPFSDVTYHSCYLGGGFGRRSMSDYVEEATHLSNAVKRPVKLVWSREDDMQYGAFRPISLQRMRAGVDAEGNITAWSHQIVGTGDGLMSSGAKSPYYTIPNQYIDLHNMDAGVRTKHWRSVGHGPNKYAIEAFIDEVTMAVNKDPYQMRRHLLRNNPRELAVVDKVAEMCQWGSPLPEGRARGMAFAERSGALVAGVAEISVDRDKGKIKVHRFWCAMDAGVVVQPDNAIAQLEGGVIFGISSVMHESITFKDGAVEQSNFHNYHIARMSDAPESIECHIIPSQEAPAGVGEASTPVVGGAIANAFLALTGKALCHMPFTSEKVKEVLEEYGKSENGQR
ncbi:MAG: xanthine dehydrogenase family protein molybdopterin-binding subunit [Saprospiraceae bacterium]|nr:xanthine dehydrogenase family protein molybdopterin-binding subunit [Saprospiraceae bacterium]